MMTSIRIFVLFFFVQFTYAQSIEISPQSEAGSKSQLNFGLFGGFMTNENSFNSYQLGLVSEYNMSSIFALELELAAEYRRNDNTFFGRGHLNELNLDLALNAKIYFTQKKLWYAKLGYYTNRNISKVSGEDIFKSKIDSGIQLGLGRNLELSKTLKLKIEPLIRYNKAKGLQGGLRAGIWF